MQNRLSNPLPCMPRFAWHRLADWAAAAAFISASVLVFAQVPDDYQAKVRADAAARLLKANSDYSAARDNCIAKGGNTQPACLAVAEVARRDGEAEAGQMLQGLRVMPQAAIAPERAEQRKDNDRDAAAVQEANYQKALDQCGNLADPAKDQCVAAVNNRFGKL
jgi:hypothetical protein